MTIPFAKDHTLERKESFYAKIKVSAFVNFVEDNKKKKMMKKSAVWEFSVYHYSGVFYLL